MKEKPCRHESIWYRFTNSKRSPVAGPALSTQNLGTRDRVAESQEDFIVRPRSCRLTVAAQHADMPSIRGNRPRVFQTKTRRAQMSPSDRGSGKWDEGTPRWRQSNLYACEPCGVYGSFRLPDWSERHV
jgi:hypothetical protein